MGKIIHKYYNMEIIEEYEIENEGVIYIVTVFDDGSEIMTPK
jgi:hypothetical protein